MPEAWPSFAGCNTDTQAAFSGETVKRTYEKCYVRQSRAGALLIEPHSA